MYLKRFHKVLTACQAILQHETVAQTRAGQWWVGPHLAQDCLAVHILDFIYKFQSHFKISKTNLDLSIPLPRIAMLNKFFYFLVLFGLFNWLIVVAGPALGL